MAGILLVSKIRRDVIIRKIPAKPGEVPRQKRNNDKECGNDDEPEIGGAPFPRHHD